MKSKMKYRGVIVTVITIVMIFNFFSTFISAQPNYRNIEGSLVEKNLIEEVNYTASSEDENNNINNLEESNSVDILDNIVEEEKSSNNEDILLEENENIKNEDSLDIEEVNNEEVSEENIESSSSKTPEDYEIQSSEYINKDNIKLLNDDENKKRVLLIQDNKPWQTESNQLVLSKITEYDLVSTTDFLSVDLSLYGVVIFANDQSFEMYENYKSFKEYLETFASIGGVIVFGACDAGWADGTLIENLPGDIKKANEYMQRNYVADKNHPIVTGELTDNQVLLDEDLYENYTSHTYFNEESLPAGTQIILRDTKDRPTLVEYPLGEGRVIASGLTWEYNYEKGGGTYGTYAKKAMDDLFTYAMYVSSINVEELSKLKEFWVGSSSHAVVVADKETKNPIKDAIVSIGGKTAKTDENGIVKFVDVYDEQRVKVEANGYRESELIYNIEPKTTRTFYLERAKDDGKPYISMALALGTIDKKICTNLLNEKRYFKEEGKDVCDIIIDGNWNGNEPGKFVIYQAEKSVSREDGLFNISPGEIFSSGKRVYVMMISKDGKSKSDPIELGIVIKEKSGFEIDYEAKKGSFSLGDKTGFSIPEGLPIIGGMDFSVELDFIPASFVYDGNKVKIGFGFTDALQVKENWDELKDTINKYKDAKCEVDWYKKVMSRLGQKTGTFNLSNGFEKPELNVAGYAEGILDDNGKLVEVKGYILVDSSLAYKYSQQFIVPVAGPLYFEIGGGVDVEFNGGIGKVLTEVGNIETDVALKFTPNFFIGGGWGINGAMSVGGEGKVELPINFDFAQKYRSVILSGSMKLKASLLFVFKAETPALKGEWAILDEYYKSRALNTDDQIDLLNMNNYSKLSRDYLNKGINNYSILSSDPELKVLKEGILPTTSPKVYKVGDTLVTVYQVDDENRNDNNRTKLVYSVYENQAWSEPVAVWDNGAPDFAATLKSYNDELYMVWQKAAKEIPNNEGTIDEQINDALSLCEIAYAKWDNKSKTFVDMQYITNNDTLDISPTLAIDDDEVKICWINNNKNNVFGAEGDNKIISVSSKKNNIWSDEVAITSVEGNVVSVDSEIINNELNIAYAIDTDNNINTSDDIEIYISTEGNSKRITNNKVADFSPMFYNSNLLWYSNNELKSYDFATEKITSVLGDEVYDISQDYRIISDGKKTAVLWLDSVSEEKDSIKASIKQEDGWSKSIKIYESEKLIECFDGTIDNAGNWSLIMNLNNSEENEVGEVINEFNTLVNYNAAPKTETVLNNIYCLDENRIGTSQGIDFNISNTGENEISLFNISVYNAVDNSLISEKNISYNLKSGKNTNINETIEVGEVTDKKDLIITITAENEENIDDNSKKVSIGYIDLKLEVTEYEVGNEIILSAKVSNISDIPANAAISIMEDKEDGIVLDMKNIGLITSENDFVYIYSIDKDKIKYNGERYKSYYITVTGRENELYLTNNTEWIVIDSNELEGYDGEPGEEIDVVNVTGVEIISPKNITLNIKDEKEYKLQATVYPENANWKHVRWTSSDTGIVQVDEDGNLKVIGLGTAEITVSTIDGGFTDKCIVNVVSKNDESSDNDDEDNNEEEQKIAVLKGLKNEGFILSPEFDSKIFNYDSIVENSIKKVKLTPILDEGVKAYISINNSKENEFNKENEINLNIGKNTIVIRTIGENMKESQYTIIVDRKAKADENLNSDSNNNNGSNNSNNGSNNSNNTANKGPNKLPFTGKENYYWLIGMLAIVMGIGIKNIKRYNTDKR